MFISRLRVQNWRNFKEFDVPISDKTYLIGPNASGKSNFLDVFRFLRDICKPQGGGLQKAIADRGGLQKLRCLHARKPPEVLIEVEISVAIGGPVSWKYLIAFKPEGKGAQRTLITQEKVWKDGRLLLDRPEKLDKEDTVRLTQTHLEQIQANGDFREIADFLSQTTYLHLVPQLLKFGDFIGGRQLDDDPFGQGFLERLATTPVRTRESRLKRIEEALKLAVPQFQELRYVKDDITGRPHLEAHYKHHRPNAGWQREEHFSDGTLRLLGLLWSLLDGNSLLLLEEPELSLNDAIVSEIPYLIQRVQRTKKRQLIISTHSEALLRNEGINPKGVLILEPKSEGTIIRVVDDKETLALTSGFSVAEVILPKTKPELVDQLRLW